MKNDAKAHGKSTGRDQESLDAADLKECAAIVRRRLKAADRGKGGVLAEDVLAEMRKIIGLRV